MSPKRPQHPSSTETVRFGRRTVELSHPDKVLFPEDGVTKADLVRYYIDVAKAMIPHLKGRPVMMARYPEGIAKHGFYQKDIPDYFPDWVRRAPVAKEGGSVTHVLCDDTATLAYLANQACITPHVWLGRVDRPDHPDQMIFDLDPSGDDFGLVATTAHDLRGLLDNLGLPAFVKLTGSKGLHVAVPLDRRADFDSVRAFARDVAEMMVRRDPDSLTTEARKAKRGGRVFIDVLRNAYAQTAVPPYAVRALPGAPVATPLRWDELNGRGGGARRYRLSDVSDRLSRTGDPWAAMARQARSLTRARRHLDALWKEVA